MTLTPPAPTVTVAVDAGPCPRATIVVTPMPADAATVTVWRYASGRRTVIRGASNTPVAGDTAFVDYDVPLGVPVVYEAQTADAGGTPSQLSDDSAQVFADSPYLWIHDPLDPASAMPIALTSNAGLGVEARFASFRTGSYNLAGTVAPVYGSADPLGFADIRQSIAGVPIELRTFDDDTRRQLLALLRQAYPLCVRGGAAVPLLSDGVAYLSIPQVTPTFDPDNTTCVWTMTGDSIAPPGAAIIIPVRTLDGLGDEAATLDGLGVLYDNLVDLQLGT